MNDNLHFNTTLSEESFLVLWCIYLRQGMTELIFFDTALFKQFLEKLSSSLSSHNWMEG